jgi:hypothetical protein
MNTVDTVNPVIDHRYDKSQKLLYKIAGTLTDSEFAADILTMVTEVSEKVAAFEVFADEETAMFPVGTMEDTVLSKLYFDSQREKIAEYKRGDIAEKLATYMDLFNIPESIFEYSTQKVAEDRFSMCLLPSLKICTVTNEAELEKAASLFDKEYTKLNVSQRVEFANNFIKAANTLETHAYPRNIAKYAGLLDTDFSNLQAMLEYRAAAATRNNKSGEKYIKLAFELNKVEGSPTDEERLKLAETIQKMDEELGFTDRKYDHQMPCAFSIVFNKEATNTDNTDLTPPTKAELVAEYGDGVLDALEDEDGNIDMEKLKTIRGMHAPVK